MTRVKICGCMRVEDALVAKEAGADFVGLVFAPGSRRRLDVDGARAIVDALGGAQVRQRLASNGRQDLDAATWFRRGAETLDTMLAEKRPLAVGVFQDQPIDELNAIADACRLDLIQLSGDESWDDCRRANRPVVNAIAPLAGAIPESVAETLEAGAAVACMLDASRGRGLRADRTVAADVGARLPIWLAGGLTPENVGKAIRDTRPWAVDVSSGVETDGAKDAGKIRSFVQAARMAAIERSS